MNKTKASYETRPKIYAQLSNHSNSGFVCLFEKKTTEAEPGQPMHYWVLKWCLICLRVPGVCPTHVRSKFHWKKMVFFSQKDLVISARELSVPLDYTIRTFNRLPSEGLHSVYWSKGNLLDIASLHPIIFFPLDWAELQYLYMEPWMWDRSTVYVGSVLSVGWLLSFSLHTLHWVCASAKLHHTEF